MPEKNEVGDAFAAALKRMLKKKSVTAAAQELGVSRQAFHAYLQGKLPRRKMLNKAMRIWDLKLDLGGYSFDKGAFGPRQEQSKPAKKPVQPTLWDALDAVRPENLKVTMKRQGKVIRFDVRIEMPA